MRNPVPLDATEIRTVMNIEPDDVVFLSGSVAENLATCKSDYDLFVYTDNLSRFSATYDRALFKTQFFRIKGQPVDVEIWDKSTITAVIEKISDTNLNNPNERTANVLQYRALVPEKVIVLLHRLLVGIPIINGTEFEHFQQALNSKKFGILEARWFTGIIDNAYEDIVGFFKEEDSYSAKMLLDQYLSTAIMVYLLKHNVPIDKPKWALAKLKSSLNDHPDFSEKIKKINQVYFDTEKSLSLKAVCRQELTLINELVE